MSPEQARGARAMLKWKVTDAARAAEVSPNTVVRMEAGSGMNSATVKAIQRAYEEAGIEFISEDGAEIGLCLRGISE